MRDVFISYSNKNKKYTKLISDHLEKQGITCWYAPRDIVAGTPWASAIVSAIKSAKFFVLVYSEESNKSVQVLREVSLAADKGRYIIPFRIDDTPIEGDMEYYLQSLHWMDAYACPEEEAVEELASKIKTILASEGETPSVETTKQPDEDIPLTTDKAFLDADDVVTEEMESCDILDVNTELGCEGKAEETVIAEEEPEEDEEEEDAPDRMQIILKWVSIVCFVLAGLSFIWDYGYPAVRDWLDKDNMYFTKISETGSYRYPFYDTTMFTTDLNMMFTQDIKTKKLALVKTDTGYPVVKDIDYKFGNPYYMECYAKEDSNIVYFLENDKKNIKIYDRAQKKWISSKGIDLGLSKSEEIVNGLYSNSSLSVEKKYTDDILLFIYDYAKDARCYSKIINLMSDGTFTVMDISEHKLVSSAGISKSSNLLMWTDDDSIRVLNLNTGIVPELSHNEIVKEYVPSLKAGNSTLSPDKRYICRKKNSGDSINVIVWELESGKKVFNSAFDKNTSICFTAKNKFLCYSRENMKVVEYTFGEEEKQRTLFDKQYFIDNKEFIEFPHSFYYSDKLNLCFFSSVIEDKKGRFKDKLVVTDLKGNILFQSDEFEVPGTSTYPDFVVKNDKIFYIYNVAGGNKPFDDGTYSIIYRATYTNDGKKITFEK